MNVWLKRLLIVAFLILWLVLLSLPAVAFIIAARGQIQLGDTSGPHVRVFLLQDAEAEGIGLERARRVEPPLEALDASCLRTSVRYWLWSGDNGADENVDFCQCTGPDGGVLTDIVPPACAEP